MFEPNPDAIIDMNGHQVEQTPCVTHLVPLLVNHIGLAERRLHPIILFFFRAQINLKCDDRYPSHHTAYTAHCTIPYQSISTTPYSTLHRTKPHQPEHTHTHTHTHQPSLTPRCTCACSQRLNNHQPPVQQPINPTDHFFCQVLGLVAFAAQESHLWCNRSDTLLRVRTF